MVQRKMLEIGPGRGDFLFKMAGENRDILFAAIEVRHKRFEKLVQRAGARGLDNIVFVNAPAQKIVTRFLNPESLERIYILFPDPWPKRRQGHYRLWNPSFFEDCWLLLQPGGSLYLATDDADYASQAEKHLEPRKEKWKREPDQTEFFETYYAAKWKKLGRTLLYMQWTKSTAEQWLGEQR